MSDVLIKLFPGISSLFLQEPVIAIARVLLIIAGFLLLTMVLKELWNL